ncbi:hypothetical protein [Thiomicrospira sp. WB1]|uniref:hypothetical protein n=1 Tax=Thiomicrospira sp. WB1 TaxID=1685380 RepID=UPI0007484374|nr:hypothetical protein [Thiomicrospira sp. WB1]KUJ72853.1 hypothetical protein AVO41_03485 [Thiomicrospira sp. WB1]
MSERPAPLRRALRNAAIIALVVAVVTQFQGETILTTALNSLFTFVVIAPALWLSYRFTQRLVKPSKPSDPPPSPPES